jgi:hypothetical protein
VGIAVRVTFDGPDDHRRDRRIRPVDVHVPRQRCSIEGGGHGDACLLRESLLRRLRRSVAALDGRPPADVRGPSGRLVPSG